MGIDFVLDKWVDARQNIPNLWSGMAEVTDSQCQVKMALSLLLSVHNTMTVALFLLLPGVFPVLEVGEQITNINSSLP